MQKIKFTVETKYGPYFDCIWIPDHQTWTDEEIEAEKQRRADQWMRIAHSYDFPSETTADTP